MTFAWYGHLKSFKHTALWLVILISWGIALFEYILQVPANRIGHGIRAAYDESAMKLLKERDEVSFHANLGLAYYRQGKYVDACFAYQEALNLDPKNPARAAALGRACIAALAHGGANRAYNINDDSGLAMGEWFDLLADRFQLPRAPRLPREEVRRVVPAMQWSFMSESRRLDNARIDRKSVV